tara:strand:+ start:1728 stop:2027 length:300 start_codon:yes stop_codon:yes gene_type:complete
MSFIADCPFCGCAVKGVSPFEVMEHLTECMAENYGKEFEMPPENWMIQNPTPTKESDFAEWYAKVAERNNPKKKPTAEVKMDFEVYEKWLLKIQGEEEE